MEPNEPPAPISNSFFALTPDRVLDSVEAALNSGVTGVRATGRAFALNSIENRVYEIEMDNGTSVVTKFYRPGRWTADQILEEHAFLRALEAAEVPVVCPLTVQNPVSKKIPTLARSPEGLFLAVFPKARARILDELSDDKLRILGRFVARLHAVGAGMGAKSTRWRLDAETYGEESLQWLTDSAFLESNMGERYRQVAGEVLDRVTPMLDGTPMQRIHGDCHLGNILWHVDQPFFVDFDDMIIGPPVQDIWMIVRGDDEIALRQRDIIVEAYEEMKPFDRSTLELIEPLRALRLIHYSAWIGRRWEDPSFPRMFPTFGSDAWWQSEIEALYQILEKLEKP